MEFAPETVESASLLTMVGTVVVVVANVVAVRRRVARFFRFGHTVRVLRDTQSVVEDAYQIEAAVGCSGSWSIAEIMIGRTAEEVGQSTSIRQIVGCRGAPGAQLKSK